MAQKRDIAGFTSNAAAASKPHSGTSWFVGIGINQYDQFPDLNNAIKDVHDIQALLVEKYDLEPDHCLLLTDAEATRGNIIALFDRVKELVQPTDKLIIYYSGHGHLDKWNKGYWIPSNAEKDNTANYIRNATLKDFIQDIAALHVLVISDACFSGSLLYQGKFRSNLVADEMEQRKSRWVLCSGRHDEEVADGKPGKNSPFAESILYVLGKNERPKLHVSSLTEQVREMTRANNTQLPEGSYLSGVDHRGGQYVFRLKGIAHEPVQIPTTITTPSTGGVLRQAIREIGSERKKVLHWLGKMGLYQLSAIVLLLVIGLTVNNSFVGGVIIALIPIVFYLAPYFPATSSHLGRNSLLLLTGAYALLYYGLLLVWKLNSGESYPWWQFGLMLVVGLGLYYLIIPRIAKNTG